MDALWQDLRYAARVLGKNKMFTIIAVLTLALGIGANTAIFSVMHAVLLAPLPYRDPSRLVLVLSDMTKRSVVDWPFSNATFFDVRKAAANKFEGFAAVRTGRQVVPAEDGRPEQVTNAVVTPNFFSLIGGRIVAGRDFSDADGQPQPAPLQGATAANTPAAPPLPVMVILSYEYWQRRFGGDPKVIGHGILSGGQGPQVVGILAPGFELLMPPSMGMQAKPDMWIAGRLAYDNALRNQVSWQVIARLREGANAEQAQTEVESIAADLRKNFTIMGTSGFHIRVEPMQKYVSREVQPVIYTLMGAVIFLLLIACANVANLLLVRASLRERELAVRAALGGTRWRLMRQMLAETFLLAGIGTVLGLFFAWLGIRELLVLAPANLPRLDAIAIDRNVLGFTMLAGLAAAVIFGLAPALYASRPDLFFVLRSAGRTTEIGGGGLRRNSLIVAEVALTFVLLTGSGLMIRSFIALQKIDPGYNPHGLITFLLIGGRGGPQPEQRAALVRQTHDKLAAIQGVESVTASTPFPLSGGYSPIRWGLEPALSDPSRFQAVDWQIVLPGYFETMGAKLIAGRTFTDADNSPTVARVLIDDFLAAKAYPNESAVGKRILIRIRTPEAEWVEVIGVVGHQRETSLAEAGREQVYFTDGFLSHGAVGRWALRTSGDPARLGDSIRVSMTQLDPTLLIAEMQPMERLLEKAQAATRFSLLLIGIFAGIAVLLAAVGLYGVLATLVRQRTSEIGVRMALGAAPRNIFQLIVGHGLRLTAGGLAAGVVAAVFLTRWMSSLLVGVKSTDPLTFVAMAVVFLCVAALAAWLPARRAAGLDPTVALRDE